MVWNEAEGMLPWWSTDIGGADLTNILSASVEHYFYIALVQKNGPYCCVQQLNMLKRVFDYLRFRFCSPQQV